jgi:glycosyltransferase involved in cell wall biosynthesis
VRQIAREYGRRGMTPIVLTNHWPRTLPRHEVYEGIPLYRISMRVPVGSVKAHLSYRATHASIRSEMLKILERHRIEMLHVQCISSNACYALLAKRILKLPLVVTTQGERMLYQNGPFLNSPYMDAVLRDVLTSADYVTACSAQTLRDMERYYGRSLAGRSRPVYNGIHTGDFETQEPYAHPKPYILGLGRLIPKKGYDVLIRAYARANIETHDLIIAGGGSEREMLEDLSRRLGVEKRVHFFGPADRPQTAALFKGCAFFVLPSRIEAQGIVNLEAMAAGKAVVAANVDGVPEIVLDGETGILVPSEDEDGFAGAMTRLLADVRLQDRLGRAGQARAQKFTWAAIADDYLDIYRSVRGAALV